MAYFLPHVWLQKSALRKSDMSLQRNCTDMSLQQNLTDMCEHDCACLTCKTYRKNWPQAALSSAHAEHFVLQAHTVDQTVHPPSSIALLGSVCLKAAAPLQVYMYR